MKLANTGQTPRPDYQTAPTAPVVAAAGGLSQPRAAPTLTPRTAGELNLNLSGGGGVLGDGHARGGNGIFGEPKVYIKMPLASYSHTDRVSYTQIIIVSHLFFFHSLSPITENGLLPWVFWLLRREALVTTV